jgi:DUF1680 family protein
MRRGHRSHRRGIAEAARCVRQPLTEQRHLELARQYLYDEFFIPLARGENVLGGRHAYSYFNSLCSSAKAYLVLGDEKYLKAAVNGFRFVEVQSWATGGWGPAESFLPRPASEYTDPNSGDKKRAPLINALSDSLLLQHDHFETGCGSQAHFKLTRYLLRITRDPHYGDSMERVMYNTVLGALPLNRWGKAFYQSNYHAHARKTYFDGYEHELPDEWSCCSGTLPQVAADYCISAYFHDADGLFVNLYIPSTLHFEHRGENISLTQSGAYPLGDRVDFVLTMTKAMPFALRFRIPEWAQAPSVHVDGVSASGNVQPGTFFTLHRTWRPGDRISLELPRRLELKPVDDQHPNFVALVSGPLVLFGISNDTPPVTAEQLLRARQREQGDVEWVTDTNSGLLSLKPFWAIKDETYFTYFSV